MLHLFCQIQIGVYLRENGVKRCRRLQADPEAQEKHTYCDQLLAAHYCEQEVQLFPWSVQNGMETGMLDMDHESAVVPESLCNNSHR